MYYETLGLVSYSSLAVPTCHPLLIEEATEMLEDKLDKDNDFCHFLHFDFIFKDFASKKADLVRDSKTNLQLPKCYFDTYEELLVLILLKMQ